MFEQMSKREELAVESIMKCLRVQQCFDEQ